MNLELKERIEKQIYQWQKYFSPEYQEEMKKRDEKRLIEQDWEPLMFNFDD